MDIQRKCVRCNKRSHAFVLCDSCFVRSLWEQKPKRSTGRDGEETKR